MYTLRCLFSKLGIENINNFKNQVSNYYDEILDDENGFDKLRIINKKINKQFLNEKYKKVGEKRGIFEFEPLGDISLKFYNRMVILNCINPNDDYFNDKDLKQELNFITAFYYFNLLYLIKPSIFYYYEMMQMIGKLDKKEEKNYIFYKSLIEIFLDKTENFIQKMSNHINNEMGKAFIK